MTVFFVILYKIKLTGQYFGNGIMAAKLFQTLYGYKKLTIFLKNYMLKLEIRELKC